MTNHFCKNRPIFKKQYTRKNTALEIEAASELAMERGVTSAKTIRRWIEATQLKSAKPPAHKLQQAHELIRGAHEYDDFWNWATEQANREADIGTQRRTKCR